MEAIYWPHIYLRRLAGAGCSEVARAVFGIDHRDAGRVKVRGGELPERSTQAAMDAGVAFVPEDLRQQGRTIEPGSDGQKLGSAALRRLARHRVIQRARERVLAPRWVGPVRPK